MKRNILYTIIIVSFILVSVFAVFAKDDTTTKLYIDPKSVIIKKATLGNTFTLNVSVANVTDLKSYEFRLNYNTAILDAINVTSSSFLSSSLYCVKRIVNETEGLIWIACMMPLNSGSGVSGSGTLETITFKVTAFGGSSIELQKTVLGDSNGNEITYVVDNGYFKSQK